jgi:hypothetical protein
VASGCSARYWLKEINVRKLSMFTLNDDSHFLPLIVDQVQRDSWRKEDGCARMLTFLTTRYPDLFQSKKVPWYVVTDGDCPS